MYSKIREHLRKNSVSYILPTIMAGMIGGFCLLIKSTDKAEKRTINNIVNLVEMHDSIKGISVEDRNHFMKVMGGIWGYGMMVFEDENALGKYFNSFNYAGVFNDTIPRVVLEERLEGIPGHAIFAADLLNCIEGSLERNMYSK